MQTRSATAKNIDNIRNNVVSTLEEKGLSTPIAKQALIEYVCAWLELKNKNGEISDETWTRVWAQALCTLGLMPIANCNTNTYGGENNYYWPESDYAPSRPKWENNPKLLSALKVNQEVSRENLIFLFLNQTFSDEERQKTYLIFKNAGETFKNKHIVFDDATRASTIACAIATIYKEKLNASDISVRNAFTDIGKLSRLQLVEFYHQFLQQLNRQKRNVKFLVEWNRDNLNWLKKYVTPLRETLSSHEVNITDAERVANLQKEVENSDDAIKELNKKITQLAALSEHHIQERDKTITALNAQLTTLTQELQDEKAAHARDVTKAKQKLQDLTNGFTRAEQLSNQQNIANLATNNTLLEEKNELIRRLEESLEERINIDVKPLNQQIQQLQKDVDDKNKQIEQYTKQNQEYQNQVHNNENQIKRLNATSQQNQETIKKYIADIHRLQNENQQIQQQNQQFDQEINRLKQLLENCEAELKAIQSTSEIQNEQLSGDNNSSVPSLQDELQQQQNKEEIKALQEQIDEKNAQIAQLQEEEKLRDELKEQISNLANNNETMEQTNRKMEELRNQITLKDNELKELRTQLEESNKKITELTTQLEERTRTCNNNDQDQVISELKKDRDAAIENANKLTNTVATLTTENKTAKKRIEDLENQVIRLEGNLEREEGEEPRVSVLTPQDQLQINNLVAKLNANIFKLRELSKEM